jgi:hypothetical protein
VLCAFKEGGILVSYKKAMPIRILTVAITLLDFQVEIFLINISLV